MTMPSRIERNLPLILDELSAAPSPDYLDDVFGRTGRMRQRPAWTFPGRWIPMTDLARVRAFVPAPPWRMIALSLLVIALLIVVAIVAVGAPRQPAPPFGPAANGDIVYASGGDQYAGDPYHRHREHGRRLYLLDVEGDEPPRRLAPDMDVADAVAFRPLIGDEIAFRALTDRGWVIFGMNADGSDIRPLTDPVPVAKDNHAANITYSADGMQLFYQSYTPTDERKSEGCCQLWVMNADGTDPHPVEQNNAAWSGVPSVSPDGRWVSYWYVFGSEPQRVKVAPVDGSKPRS